MAPRRTRLVALVLAVALAACSGQAGPGSADDDCERIAGVRSGLCPIPVEERVAAPDASVEVLGGDDELSLADHRGEVVVLNFWASWCGPCRTEQPDLNEAVELLPDDEVAFLGVNIEDSRANARAHEREFDIPYPSLYDPANRFASRFEGVGPRTIPSTILIDAEGRVAARVFGVTTTGEIVGLADAIATRT